MAKKQRKSSKQKAKHLSLKERIKGHTPKKCPEWYTGEAIGKEILNSEGTGSMIRG